MWKDHEAGAVHDGQWKGTLDDERCQARIEEKIMRHRNAPREDAGRKLSSAGLVRAHAARTIRTRRPHSYVLRRRQTEMDSKGRRSQEQSWVGVEALLRRR